MCWLDDVSIGFVDYSLVVDLKNLHPSFSLISIFTSGKLTGAAPEGEGRLAKINLAIARERLRRHLDVGQILGNGIDTRLAKPAISGRSSKPKSGAFAQPPESFLSSGGPNLEPVEDQLKRERLFQVQIRSRKAAEDEQARKGRFTDTEEVRAANMRIAGEMIQTFEGALPTMVAAVASRFEVPVREFLHLLRTEFTNIRAKAAEQLREKAWEHTLINDVVGQAYEAAGESPPWRELRDCALGSDYARGQIPAGAVILTLGVDVQDERCEWHLDGWDQDLRRYVLDYGVVPCYIGEQETHKELDAVVDQTWVNAYGYRLELDMTAIDGNAYAAEVLGLGEVVCQASFIAS